MDDVRVRPGPQRCRRPAQVLGHFLHFQHRAVAEMARSRRLAVADYLLAHHGTPAIRTDQRCSSDGVASRRSYKDFRSLDFEIRNSVTRAQLDKRLGATTVQ